MKPIAERYGTLADQMEKQASAVDHQANKLLRAAEAIHRKNSELLHEVNSLSWYWYVAVALVLLLLGVFCGITWEQRNVASAVYDLRDQTTQLQQTIKAAQAPPPAPTPVKKGKRD